MRFNIYKVDIEVPEIHAATMKAAKKLALMYIEKMMEIKKIGKENEN